MNGEIRMRCIDWRTEAAGSVNDSTAHGGRIPVSASSSALNPSSVSSHQPAVGVMDQQDLAGAELALADGQRADHVVGDHPARVSQHVRLADLEPEQAEDVDPRVHAGHDRQVLARRHIEVPLVGEVAVAARPARRSLHRRSPSPGSHSSVLSDLSVTGQGMCRAVRAYGAVPVAAGNLLGGVAFWLRRRSWRVPSLADPGAAMLPETPIVPDVQDA